MFKGSNASFSKKLSISRCLLGLVTAVKVGSTVSDYSNDHLSDREKTSSNLYELITNRGDFQIANLAN